MSTSVWEQCQTCVQNLEIVSSAAVNRPEQKHKAIDEQAKRYLERFNLWTEGVGARHKAQSSPSLDRRLRHEPEILDHIHELLLHLAKLAEELLEIIEEDSHGESEFVLVKEEDTVYKNEATELLEEMETCLSSLFSIKSVIRQVAPPIDIFIEATRRARYDFNDEFDIAHVGEKFPHLATEDAAWLRRRLGRAITRRRQYLSYIQEDRDGLDVGHTGQHGTLNETEALEERSISTEKKAMTERIARYFKKQKQKEKLDPPSQSSALITKASTIHTGQLTMEIPAAMAGDDSDPDDNDDSSTTTASRHINSDIETACRERVPRLDGLRSGPNGEVECSFCLRMKRFQNAKTWQRHVFSDLRAYVCTYPECDDVYFRDINRWFRHELDHRVKYICRICPDKVSKGREDYLHHVQDQHSRLLELKGREYVLDLARQPLKQVLAQDCPCCSDWASRIKDRAQLPPKTPENIIHVTPTSFKLHLASHLEHLAIFAVPLGSKSDEADSDTLSDTAIEASLDDGSSQLSDHSDLTSVSTIISPILNQSGDKELKPVADFEKRKLAPDEIPSRYALAGCYERQGELKKAIKILMEVVAMPVRTPRDNHSYRLASQYALAGYYKRNEQLKEAIKTLEDLVDIQARILGKDHPDRCSSLYALALNYKKNSQVKEAIKTLEELVAIQSLVLRHDDRDLRASQYALSLYKSYK